MQFSTLALSPGLCSEEGYKAGVTIFLFVVTENREHGCGAVREKPLAQLAASVGNKDFKAG